MTGDSDPRDRPYDDGEHEAAVRAAEHLLAGPTITVPRSTWRSVITLLREAARLMQDVLVQTDADEAHGDTWKQ